MVLTITVPVLLELFPVWSYWERKYMTKARKKELESKRLEKHKTRLAARIWGVASEMIVFALPILFVVDGMVLKIGILYSPYLSFFNPYDTLLQMAGLIISLVGLIIMTIAVRTVTEQVYSKAAEERKIIMTGLFAYIRHPLYLSFILVPLGILLMSLNYLSLLLFVAFTVVTNGDLKECGREGKFTFITTSSECEEKGLINIYGKNYEEYMEKTGRLLPRFRKKQTNGKK
ncbi:MAG: methyltransferase family protein [Candidatus Thorarchaeota archaeon]|jgi:protein-S-isoprenylcysteine O-methyltransferase Ste14